MKAQIICVYLLLLFRVYLLSILDYINFSMKQIEQIYINKVEKCYMYIRKICDMCGYIIKFRNTFFINV